MPNEIELEAGDEVVLVFENHGRMSHNLHIPKLGVQTDTIGPGRSTTVRLTPESTGTLRFLCEVPGHEEAGMTGEITVR